MYTYNISIEEEMANKLRAVLGENVSMQQWMQSKINHIISQMFVADSIVAERRRQSMQFIDSLALKGPKEVPADENGMDAMIEDKYN